MYLVYYVVGGIQYIAFLHIKENYLFMKTDKIEIVVVNPHIHITQTLQFQDFDSTL